MAASKGRDFVLKVGVGGTPVTVAGMKTTSMSINGETVDVTTKDSAGKRELLASAGTSSMSISASGLLSANAQATDLIAKAFAMSIDPYTLVFDNGDKIEGNFQLTSFESSGEYNDVQTYSIKLEGSGTMTLTPVA